MESRPTHRYWVLGALMLSMIVVGLDSTVLNVALPTLATQLHATTSQLQWIVDAYLLVLGGLMLPLGALADRVGRKPVLVAGVVVFTLGSLTAAYVTSPGWLIATRAVMGMGAAVVLTVPLAVLPTIFTPAERPRAIATMMVAMGLGLPLGPIVGGWLLQNYWWGSVFLINVPIVIIGLVGIALIVPESTGQHTQRLDPLGVVLSVAGLMTLVYGIVHGGDTRDWGSVTVWGWILLGIGLLALFVWLELRSDHP